jgi:hypothetical protein
VKLLETEVFWNDRPLLQIKKQSFLIWWLISEEEYKIDIRKLSTNNRPF